MKNAKPPKMLEAVVRMLLPRSRREEILGDLRERYTGPGRYVADALPAIGGLWFSHMRRSHPGLVLATAIPATLGILAGRADRMAGAAIVALTLLILGQLYRRRPCLPGLDRRGQLERRRDALRSLWRWYVLPFVAALVLFVVRVPGMWPNMAPFTAVCVVWAAAMVKLSRRDADRLQGEIDRMRRS